MTKQQKITLARGLVAKSARLRAMMRDHLNAEGWDSELISDNADKLLGDIIDIAGTLRNELK